VKVATLRPTEDPGAAAAALARRLAALRRGQWADLEVTQRRLGHAIGGDRPLSAPTISSWENPTNPRIPRVDQLAAYARFFATRRSVREGLLSDDDLTPAERDRRRELESELVALRSTALRRTGADRGLADPLGEMWRFADGRAVTIVCSDVPDELRKTIPRAAPTHSDYEEMYSYTELDALIELFGHIRAVNPAIDVTIRAASTLRPNDYTTHLVVLGGVEHNPLARELHARLDIPVRQVPAQQRFEPTDPDDHREFRPVIVGGDNAVLTEDVAHLYRADNPFNIKRSVTLCSGVFGRGVLGAVRTLTHARFRNRNELYVRANFASPWSFGILMRVPVVNGQAMTPDWTVPEMLLDQWPKK
jgi:hypothetical protein